MPPEPTWYVYILRCADDTLYTGITTDLTRRVREHNTGTMLGARYTRARRPVEPVYVEAAETRSVAARREAQLKRMSRADKLALIGHHRAANTDSHDRPD